MSSDLDLFISAVDRGDYEMTSKSADIIPFERTSGGGERTAEPAGPSPEQTLARELANANLTEVETYYDTKQRVLWAYQRHLERPSFTPGLLRDVRRFQTIVAESCAPHAASEAMPVRYLVWGSMVDGVFNLGGDLGLFADAIMRRDRDGLAAYAKACIDICYPNAVKLDLPIITVALCQGDTLGGGFESALSSDILVAERRARFGLPEILFGLFPGMGAYSFLGRRIGAKAAEKMIFSGKIYTAEELHAMGVVDVLADDGLGEDAVIQHIHSLSNRFAAYRSVYRIRQRFAPVTYEELMDIANIWVEAALTLTESDVKKMRRLAAAQARRRNEPAMRRELRIAAALGAAKKIG
jgi:DSF synthase